MCVTRRCRLCIIFEEFGIYVCVVCVFFWGKSVFFLGKIDRGRSMCVTRRCRLFVGK
jgi:hypothetical protein